MNEKDFYKKALQQQFGTRASNKHATLAKRRKQHSFLIILPATALACLLLLNLSPTFATATAKLTGMAGIISMITWHEYDVSNDALKMHVEVPKFIDEANPIKQKLNAEIEARITALATDMEKEAVDFKEGAISMGGYTTNSFPPIKASFSYDVKLLTDTFASFAITKREKTFDMITPTYYFYNVDLTTGKELNITDVLGANFSEIVDTEVAKQIEKKAQQDQNFASFYKKYITDKYLTTLPDQHFYINEAGHPVIFYYEGEIAPAYAGEQHFVMPNTFISLK